VNIAVSDAGGVTVVRFEGNLDTNTAPDAQEMVLIDFEALDYISSAGLRVLLATAKKLRGSSGKLHMCSLNEMVTEVFEISGFSTIFSVFTTESEALEGF
jgi:anti-sigma B factor antagonist